MAEDGLVKALCLRVGDALPWDAGLGGSVRRGRGDGIGEFAEGK